MPKTLMLYNCLIILRFARWDKYFHKTNMLWRLILLLNYYCPYRWV
jgi:hypothetical protein